MSLMIETPAKTSLLSVMSGTPWWLAMLLSLDVGDAMSQSSPDDLTFLATPKSDDTDFLNLLQRFVFSGF